jgi:hypothetical protein
MTPEYFDNHITLCSTGTFKNTQQGILFDLTFKITIDWFEVKSEEQNFLIWLSPDYIQLYPELGLPDSVLLSKDQIYGQINNTFFSEPIPVIASVNHLFYSSKQEAIEVLAHAAGVNNLCSGTLYIQYEDVNSPKIGNPVLSAFGTLNSKENQCVSGIMDLVTGDYETNNYACMIDFCFGKGTKIIQSNNLTKSIEKIEAGDTILSFNQKTLQVEKDVVRQVDSVKHKDIVHILFSDFTKNENTSDHPYWVTNKGWCSYRPLQTNQKYDLRAKQLQIGDTCLKYQNNKLTEILIRNINENPGEVMTFNISRLEKNNTFFANGILVSNEKK